MENKELEQEIKKKITNIPLKDRAKVTALRYYLNKCKQADTDMETTCDNIQSKYDKLSMPIYQRADEIILGTAQLNEQNLGLAAKLLSEEELQQFNEAPKESKAIPDYWLKVFKNADLQELPLSERDAEAFKFLQKIEFTLAENDSDFFLKFHFAENPFFKQTVLEKKFYYEDDELTKVEATKIEWHDGKNLTKKLIKKKQRNKKTGQFRVISKEVDDESFFLFFRSIDISNKEKYDKLPEDEQISLQGQLDVDQDVGREIVDELLPYSLEYFLGIKEFKTEDDAGAEGEEDDEEDDEEVEVPAKGQNKGMDKKKK
ncbi:unnamed protein product [Paramecium octaurelia]|uniref:Nucleosome assembly protein n=1 Tax=Paramecium octaurelia TaxID=43137 RepID=A0A8S1VMP5_PAROT|nr:unnamed protein product [Paramecium octaurelia]